MPDPPRTPSTASINRVVIVDLPGLAVDSTVRGEQAYHLLSLPTLIRYALERAAALKLPLALRSADPELPAVRRDVPRWVDAALSSADPEVHSAAWSIAERLGRNLGYVLVALHRGDAVNRAARPDWTEAEWSHWHSIRHVWLGGGIVSGDLGRAMLHHARTVLAESGCADMQLDLTIHQLHMAVLGAARYLPRATDATKAQRALIFDLGHTSVKRGVLTYSDDAVVHVAYLPAVPVAWRWRNSPDASRDIDGHQVLDFVVSVICATMDDAARQGWQVDSRIAMSIAAYVDGGRLLGNGMYARMSTLADDVRPLIAAGVATACRWRPELTVIHDGTAAAAVHAGGVGPSAVVVVGTALGVGFPPASAEGLRRIAPDVVLDDIHEA
ncbi:MAG: hypothetical protein MUF84_03990 [Anaerolineae bacterium]|nr:hypothetical protein [Anaerolineae bacterium]